MKLKDWADRLIWATVLISVVRYAAAFAASDVGQITGIWSSVLTFFLSVTGLGMGILDTIGGGLLFNGWSKVLPRHGAQRSARFNILSVCVFTLLISGLFILVPFTMSRLSHESVLDALGGKSSFWAWMWSLMVNLIPYVLIAGVFVGNKMVSSLETEEVSETSGKKQEGFGASARESSESFRKFPKDWRSIEPTLTYEQTVEIANLTPIQMREWANRIGITEKTISNWRASARLKLQKREG